jgi:predicted site-specific integrase-resolvase
VNLTEWAHAQGIHVMTAYRWYREGTLPVPVRKVGRLTWCPPDTAAAASLRGGVGLYARVSCHDQRADLDRQVTDGLVRDMIEVLTSFCARLYGRRPARNWALKAVGCAQRDIGPQAMLRAGSAPCGDAG